MKKVLLSLLSVMLCALAYAQDPVLSVTPSASNMPKNSSYTGSFNLTEGDNVWVVAGFNNNNNGWSSNPLRCGRKGNASTPTFSTNFAISEAIEKVSFKVVRIKAGANDKVNAINLLVADDNTYANAKSYSVDISALPTSTNGSGELSVEIPEPAAGKYYRLAFDLPSATNNGFLSLNEVAYYAVEGGGPTTIAAPSIACADNMVTITNNEEGASVYYTIDGTEPDVNSTLYTAPFAITETCTVKAVAIKDGESSILTTYTATFEAPAEVEPFTSSIAAVDDVITATRGAEITFTSLHAAKIAVEIEVEGQEATTTEVESDKFVYTVSEAAIISLTSYNVDGTEAHSAVYEIALEAAPLCGEVVFNPASGSAVIAGSEVTITCENAATISYFIEINGEPGDAIEVEGNEAKVVVNEACTIHADAKNIDGVLSEAAEASYTIAEAPATGSAMFDFTKVDEIKAMTSENITPSNGSALTGNTYLSGITLTEASGISVSFVKNPSDANYPRWFGPATTPTDARIYTGNTVTVSAPAGSVITSIVFAANDNRFGLSASTGSISNMTWTPAAASAIVMREAAEGAESVVFTATAQNRIATMKVNYERTTVGVGNVVVDDANAPVEYYNLQGVRVENPANGLYIRRQGNNVSKVFVR